MADLGTFETSNYHRPLSFVIRLVLLGPRVIFAASYKKIPCIKAWDSASVCSAVLQGLGDLYSSIKALPWCSANTSGV